MTALLDAPPARSKAVPALAVHSASPPALAVHAVPQGRDALAMAGGATAPADMTDDQLFQLIPLGEDWSEYEDKTTPRHTAQRLKSNDPVKFETLRRALEAGSAITTLARSHKVGVNTLYAIIEAELGGREAYHASLAKKFKTAANMGVDKVMELMPSCGDLMQAGIVTGIMADKAMLLAGAPTLIVEHRHTDGPAAAQKLQEMIDEGFRLIEERKVQGRVVDGETEGMRDGETDGHAPSIPLSLSPSVPQSGKEAR